MHAALASLSAMLAAVADAHSPRALAKRVADVLGTQRAIRCVAIAGVALARSAVGWTETVAPAQARELVPGLAIGTRGALSSPYTDPAFLEVLARVVETAIRHVDAIERLATVSRTSHEKGRELRDRLARAEHPLVARSSAMQAVVARVQLVARHPTTVLVVGESGTGKELVARELHRLSPRARRPFLQLNCGAIPADLVESELFGHERGAFTGADRVHLGVFERASSGTLLLDELGDLPMAAQAKLLRVLQERTIRRVGGVADLPIDVRLVAATHRDLRAMVASGTFREDLYYRLAVFSIEVPSLRDRRGDLAPLATALVAELAASLEMDPVSLTRADLARLDSHAWPGNVRELRNVLETMLVVGELPPFPRVERRANASLDSALRDAIEGTLRSTRGKIYGDDGAAARLGLPPATLQSKMKRLGISRDRFRR